MAALRGDPNSPRIVANLRDIPSKVSRAMTGLNLLDFSPQSNNDRATPRPYRTRPDPFAEEWHGIVEILMANDTVGAKAILDLLIQENPEKFNWTHLRTLQRGVRKFREQQALLALQTEHALQGRHVLEAQQALRSEPARPPEENRALAAPVSEKDLTSVRSGW